MFYRLKIWQEYSISIIFKVLGLMVCCFLSGCAVNYIDEDTGQWKVIGFVNMELPVVVTKNSNVKVNVNSAGLLFHSTPYQNSLSLGYSQTSAIFVANENDILILDNNQNMPSKEIPQGESE